MNKSHIKYKTKLIRLLFLTIFNFGSITQLINCLKNTSIRFKKIDKKDILNKQFIIELFNNIDFKIYLLSVM